MPSLPANSGFCRVILTASRPIGTSLWYLCHMFGRAMIPQVLTYRYTLLLQLHLQGLLSCSNSRFSFLQHVHFRMSVRSKLRRDNASSCWLFCTTFFGGFRLTGVCNMSIPVHEKNGFEHAVTAMSWKCRWMSWRTEKPVYQCAELCYGKVGVCVHGFINSLLGRHSK